jgi:hypothetical protein
VLSHGEDKGIVDREAGALGLHDVQIVSLGVRRGMTQDKVVWRVFSRVHHWQSEGHWMRDVAAGVHKPLLAGVDLQHTLAFVSWQDSFDGDPLLAVEPVWLNKGALAHDIAAFEKVPVCIASECRCFDLGSAFNVGRDYQADLDAFQAFDTHQAGIVIWELRTKLEELWADTRQSK